MSADGGARGNASRAARSLPSAAALGLFGGLVAWLTWPLGGSLASHLPETSRLTQIDAFYAIWALGWQGHALATDPLRLADANIYHPAPMALFYGAAGFGVTPYFTPTFLWTGNPALAANVAVLGCLALGAWTTYLVVRRWTGSWAAGMAAGTTFLLTPVLVWMTTLHVQYVAQMYFPLVISLAAGPLERRGEALALALLVAAQAATDLVYFAPSVFGTLALVAAMRLARRRSRRAGLRIVGALVVAAALLAPAYAGYAIVRRANPELRSQTVWATERKTRLELDLERWRHPLGTMGVPVPALVLVGGGALALAAGAARGRRSPALPLWGAAATWAVAAVAGVGLLTSMQWSADLLAELVLRRPERLRFGGLAGLCLLTGLAFGEVARLLPSRVAVAALGLVFGAASYASYASVVPAAFPLFEAPVPGRIEAVVRERGGPVLELPVDGTAPNRQAPAMYRSLYHWQPLLNGYASYFPEHFPERMAEAGRLPDAAALRRLAAETGLRTIVVRWAKMPPAERRAWLEGTAGRTDLRALHVDAAGAVFAVDLPPGPASAG